MRAGKVLISAFYGFTKDECSLKATALAYYSVLSIVPVLAVAFGIAKGFGFEEVLKEQILELFGDYPTLADKFIEFARSFLEHAQGGVIAGVGVIFLFFTALKLLHQIEYTFNGIWKVEKARSWVRMLSDYLTVLILCPLFIIIGSSVSIFVFSKIEVIPGITGIAGFITPFILSCLLFSLLFMVMPNTRVAPKYAWPFGILTGIAYQVVQWGYIHFQTAVSDYSAIYGSFAAIPLFLLWVQISWSIALFGAELCYHASAE